MSNDLNQCNFIGRLGRDPEIRYMADGKAIANFSIAVGTKYKPAAGGEAQEHTEWVRISAFGKLAEIIGQYCKKGGQVFVGGRMRTRKWQDKEGQDRFTTEIIAETMQLLGKPSEAQEVSPKESKPAGTMADMTDDIPF